jgi:hypothetical protein
MSIRLLSVISNAPTCWLEGTIDIVTAGLKAGKTAETMRHDGVLDKYVTYDTFIPMLNTGYWIETVSKNYEDMVLSSPEK